MKLASFVHSGAVRIGLVEGCNLVELVSESEQILTMKQLIQQGLPGALAGLRRGQTLPLDATELLPPVPDAGKVVGIGLNYHRHAMETGKATPTHPAFFARFAEAQVGHGAPLVRPRQSEQFDFEGELTVIIGRRARHVALDRALDHVAGYCCFADNSVRDFQRHSMTGMAGKNFPASGACGPWMVTADEVPDPDRLTVITRLNGVEVQRGATADMIFSVARLIAYLSTVMELVPGDMIATGTPEGVGSARHPPLWLHPGDRLEVEIPGIGKLSNPVVAEQPTAGVP